MHSKLSRNLETCEYGMSSDICMHIFFIQSSCILLAGFLQLEIVPCNKEGGDIGDDYVDDPAELVGRGLYFKIKIPNARGLNAKYEKVM